MGTGSLNSESRLREAVTRRAEEIYKESGRVPGRDVENWMRAEREVLSEMRRASQRRTAFVIRVDGFEYLAEYNPASSNGYKPGEFEAGDPVPVRFEGDSIFVRRKTGEELGASIVRKTPITRLE